MKLISRLTSAMRKLRERIRMLFPRSKPKIHHLEASSSRMMLSSYVLDQFIAPELANLKAPKLPDLPEASDYFGSLVLNGIFRVQFADDVRCLASPPISCCGTPELREGLKCLE